MTEYTIVHLPWSDAISLPIFHPDFNPIRTNGILLFKITTFCPNMTKITAADLMVNGCF